MKTMQHLSLFLAHLSPKGDMSHEMKRVEPMSTLTRDSGSTLSLLTTSTILNNLQKGKKHIEKVFV